MATNQEIINEINRLRTNPAGYADQLLARRSYYSQFDPQPRLEGYSSAGGAEPWVVALDEAVNQLRNTNPMQPVSESTGLDSAARDHLNDMISHNFFGHNSSDGSDTNARASRYGSTTSGIYENIDAGRSTAQEIVEGLVIDAGWDRPNDPNLYRGHRTNLLNPNHTVVGVAFGSHPQYQFATVMDFAPQYTEFGNTSPSPTPSPSPSPSPIAGADYLYGDESDDVLMGSGGNDTLSGQGGNDFLYGDFGDDILLGGSGVDVFAFAPGTGFDVIADYNDADDYIGLAGGLTPNDIYLQDSEYGAIAYVSTTGQALGLIYNIPSSGISSGTFYSI